MESRDVVASKGELPNLGRNGQTRTRKVLSDLGNGLLILLFAAIIAASSQISYDYLRYEKFFVNGESMYPTLNRDTERYTLAGEAIEGGPTYAFGDFSAPGTYVCDYGITDASPSFRGKLRRYSVVVSYFDGDMRQTPAGDYAPTANAELKIKRLIGLPGESLYFDGAGDLFVKKAGQDSYGLTPQPFFDVQSDWTAEEKTWVSRAKPASGNGNYGAGPSHPVALGEGEYFLCGDNRSASTDSRTYGPVHAYALQGKAIAVTAKCSYRVPAEAGNAEWHPLWNRFLWPWDLHYLTTYESA